MALSDYSELLAWVTPRVNFGDVVEVGVLIGNGTRQLADAFPMKTIWAVDTFDIGTDPTKNQDGVPMRSFYESELKGRDQLTLFRENVSGWKYLQVRTFIGRSSDFPAPPEIFLSIIDGGHSPADVQADYEKLQHSRFVAFHDYKHDMPELTQAIDAIAEGKKTHVLPGWLIIIR